MKLARSKLRFTRALLSVPTKAVPARFNASATVSSSDAVEDGTLSGPGSQMLLKQADLSLCWRSLMKAGFFFRPFVSAS